MPNCDKCGRFFNLDSVGASGGVVLGWYEISHDINRCPSCTEKHGRCIGGAPNMAWFNDAKECAVDE